MLGLGTHELLIIFAVVLLLFGARKLPELARGMGSGLKEFKKGLADGDREDSNRRV
ncbi:MAG: twin-arginine translocase TatA/TatE family subunit [Armatimonadota bacterium]|nr:twin-arginine translocase TatA/TatE family subunit [Armatimonadota bacterium]